MEALLLGFRIFLFGVFAAAGLGKLFDFGGAEKAVKEFGVPESVGKFAAVFLIGAELLIAAALLPVSTSWFGAVGATVLLAVFIGGMIWQLAKGNAPDCHCFGAVHSEPVSKKSLIRNAGFFAMAAILAVRGGNGQGQSLAELSVDMLIQLVLGLATIALLGAVVFYLKKISEQQTQILRRIDVFELVGSDAANREVQRENAGHPNDSLPIGAIAPDFELPATNGRVVSLEHLLTKRTPMVLFFISPTCTPCQALLAEIKEWKTEFGDNVEFVFLSSGTVEANAAKFAGSSAELVLLQDHREVAEMYYAKWTPTAVFINADGLVGSHLAVGDEGIRDLMHKVKSIDFTKSTVFLADAAKVKIGQSVPEFTMNDVQGREISANYFSGKKTLVAFWSTTCPHCLKMIHELQEWDREKGADEPNLLIFSEGDDEDHREFGMQSPIVLDEGYKTAEKFGMHGTPSAVMINENGQFVSETAIGAANIWALVGKKR